VNSVEPKKGNEGLETAISYLLIAGVLSSMILEIVGVILFYHTYGTPVLQYGNTFIIQGHDFFSFISEVVRGKLPGGVAIQLMTAGILVLMLTPFLRVVFSMVYFAWEKNYKFVLITLFVLVVLTISLTFH
jgi:uncharacterized membrane protein